MGKDSISWTERVFCFFVALLYYWLYLIRIDGASYLDGYCSLMFFMHVFNDFFKKWKSMFLCFFFNLQSNVFNIYAYNVYRIGDKWNIDHFFYNFAYFFSLLF